MGWIESHTVLIRHRKTIELSAWLSIKPVAVMGHLTALWHSALEQQEDGCLGRWADIMIARYAAWEGNPEEFVKGLIEVGWMDPDRKLHDWLDYAGRYLISRYKTSNPNRLVEIWLRHGIDYKTGAKVAIQAGKGTGKLKVGLKAAHQHTNPPTNLPNLPTDTPPKKKVAVSAEQIELVVDRWNTFASAHGLTRVVSITERRKKGVRRRLADPAFRVDDVFKEIHDSQFLQGKIAKANRETPWRVDFDFVFCSEKWVRIIEGRYRDGEGPKGTPRAGDRRTINRDDIEETLRKSGAV